MTHHGSASTLTANGKRGVLLPTHDADFRFSWQAYGTVPAVINYDDLIIATARIACAD